MTALLVYARIYLECAEKAVRGVRRGLWTLLLPVLLISLFGYLEQLLAPLGWLGGFLWIFALDALFSAYLYFVGEIVANAKVRMTEFGRSLRAYFWAIVNFTFVLWLAKTLLSFGLSGNPNGGPIFYFFWLAVFILLNAAPEVLYIKGTYGAQATLTESLAFIQSNWIEWFLPNVIFGALIYFAIAQAPPAGSIPRIIFDVALGGLFHLLMIFRGYLFQTLSGSSHRQRMYRYRSSL
jgi:hypothetical protein